MEAELWRRLLADDARSVEAHYAAWVRMTRVERYANVLVPFLSAENRARVAALAFVAPLPMLRPGVMCFLRALTEGIPREEHRAIIELVAASTLDRRRDATTIATDADWEEWMAEM